MPWKLITICQKTLLKMCWKYHFFITQQLTATKKQLLIRANNLTVNRIIEGKINNIQKVIKVDFFYL